MNMVRNVSIVLTLTALMAASAVAAQSKSSRLIVVGDAGRGALLRWSLPQEFPRNGFQVERTAGGKTEVLATLKPGAILPEATLGKERAGIVTKYLELTRNPSLQTDPKKASAAKQGRLGLELMMLSDPMIAAALGLSYEDKTAPLGSVVGYTVRGLEEGGQSRLLAAAPPAPLIVLAPPEPPASFSGQAKKAGVVLAWGGAEEPDNPAAAVAYEIRRRDALLTPSPLVRISGSDVATPGFVDDKAPVETKSLYTVTALDIFGRRGPESAPIEVFVPDFTALDPPPVVGVSTSPGSVTVTWTAPENKNRKGWKILRSQNPESGGDVLTSQPLAKNSFTDSTGNVGSAYYYQITAVNLRGDEGLPKVSGVVVFRGSAPGSPTALAATLKTGRVILKWTPPAASVNGYQIERSIGGKEWTILNSEVTAQPQYEDLYPLDVDGVFRYRVVAWSLDSQKSPPSEVLEVNLPDTNPPLKPVINSVSGDGGLVTLRFSPSGGSLDASGFYVLKSVTRDNVGEIVNATPLGATATELVDRDVEAGAEYFYRVFAVDKAGNRSDPSDTVNVLVGEPPLPPPPLPRARFEPKPFPRVVLEFAASTNSSVRYALERQDAAGVWFLIQGPLPQETTTVTDAHPVLHSRSMYRLMTIGSKGSDGPRSAAVQVEVP